jgi:hypothetical protein
MLTLLPIIAFMWPSAATPEIVVSIRHIADIGRAETEFRRVLLANSKHKPAVLRE